jgi:hypothetical protein
LGNRRNFLEKVKVFLELRNLEESRKLKFVSNVLKEEYIFSGKFKFCGQGGGIWGFLGDPKFRRGGFWGRGGGRFFWGK